MRRAQVVMLKAGAARTEHMATLASRHTGAKLSITKWHVAPDQEALTARANCIRLELLMIIKTRALIIVNVIEGTSTQVIFL